MQSIYTAFKCRTCKLEFILLSEDIDKMAKDRYVCCPFCSSKRINKENEADDLREVMKERSYRRIGGALRQK